MNSKFEKWITCSLQLPVGNWLALAVCGLISLAAQGQPARSGADDYWTKEKIEFFNKKYAIHDQGYHYHYPRQSFLKYGYYPPGGYINAHK